MEHTVKKGGFVKKSNPKTKLKFLEDNLAVIESQRHISAIEGMGKMYKKNKKLSEDQETYLDILVENVKRVRAR